MSQKAKFVSQREEFFALMHNELDKHSKDETVTHLFVVALHGKSENADEQGAPVSFAHNLADDMQAAHLLNNLTVGLFMVQQEYEEQQTRQ